MRVVVEQLALMHGVASSLAFLVLLSVLSQSLACSGCSKQASKKDATVAQIEAEVDKENESSNSTLLSYFIVIRHNITRTESRSVGFEPTTSGFGDPRSTELN